jgi:short-subunit dehydrogenase
VSKKVVVITGASSGIGAELAKLLGSNGDRIVLAARREQKLNEIAASSGRDAVTVVTDVTKREDVDHLKKVALEKCGRVDVWINNAGRGISRHVLDLSDDDVDQMIAVNFKSALYGMQAIVPCFQQQGKGHLINVSSFLSQVPLVSFRSVYSAAKAALNMLTANLRMDLLNEYPDIHVSVVMPGVVWTDFGKNALGGTPNWGSGGGRPPHGQTAAEVAATIAELIEHPKSEVYTNPASPGLAKRYREDPDTFEREMMKRG